MFTANKIKEEFLSVMSHELRTPLSVVMGYAGMLREKMLGDVNPQQEEALRKILSRVAEHGPINLPAWLAHVRSELEATHDKKEVALLWDYPSDPVSIVIDAGKLRQVLHNLVENALKFTRQGSVTVSAGLVNGNGPAGYRPPSPSRHSHFLEVKVADTGAGIPSDQLPLVFDKFYQRQPETRLRGGPAWLYIVKKITDLPAPVAVESRLGAGSTFTVTVPYAT
jgi:signal transduction histidine kinase